MDPPDFEEGTLNFENPLVLSRTEAVEVPSNIALPEDISNLAPVMIFEDSEPMKQERRRSTLTRTPSPDTGNIFYNFIRDPFKNIKNQNLFLHNANSVFRA